MRRTITLIAVLSAFSEFSWAIDTHCMKNELIIFNCRIGTKIISVCAAKSNVNKIEYVQYRFGSSGALELVYPELKSSQVADIKSGTLAYSGGGGAYLRFKRDQYSYVVYTAIGKGWGEKAGIAVEKDGKLHIALKCKKPVQSELGPDFFELAQLPVDQTGFELPTR